MRLIKLSVKEFKDLEAVHLYFQGPSSDFRTRGNHGIFCFPPRWIDKDGLDPDEKMLFSYRGQVVYVAKALSGRMQWRGPDSADYPYYFQVDLDSLQQVSFTVQAFETALSEQVGLSKSITGRTWPRLSDDAGTAAVVKILSNINTAFEQELAGIEMQQMRVRAEDAGLTFPNENEVYVPQGDDRRLLVERQIRERRGQAVFRDGLRKRYGDRCLVTGCEVLAVLEAAHISPYLGEEDNHPGNGLLLRTDIHTLFDLDLLGIEPESLRVELHPDVSKEYGQFSGKTLACSELFRPSPKALQQRYELFKKLIGNH